MLEKRNAPLPGSIPMNMQKSRFKTLFLCTGNSARSILAEYLLRKAGRDRFEVFSAGVNPKAAPHPIALAILRDNFQIDASDARSKSVDEFKDVEFDFVITVCDKARETCPVWPGRPIIAHWSSPDPSKVEGDECAIHEAFWKVAQQINLRVELLVALPLDKLDALRLEGEMKAIANDPNQKATAC
jgi:arsenate reductase (thioredoxin)